MNKRYLHAIRIAANVGLILKIEHTEIKDRFLGGENARQINISLNVPDNYGVSLRVGNAAVRFCLKGYFGELGIDSYEGQLSFRDYIAECKRQRHLLSQRFGNQALETQVGIFSLDEETRLKIRSRAGKRAKELGKGIHSLTTDERRVMGANAGYLSAIKRGAVPWESEQVELVRLLISEGRTNRAIAEFVNKTYFQGKPVRTTDSVYNLIRNRLS